MENIDYKSTNIHLDWLQNIKEQLYVLQSMQRLAIEGCESLSEYLEIPVQMKSIIIPDAQYKNMRFFVLELYILLDNLKPIILDKVDDYEKKLQKILDRKDNREYFLSEQYSKGKIVGYELKPFFYSTINALIQIKSEIISEIGHILYISNDEKNKPWK